jgi:hypothetical protein
LTPILTPIRRGQIGGTSPSGIALAYLLMAYSGFRFVIRKISLDLQAIV